jgi:hypothetical protein
MPAEESPSEQIDPITFVLRISYVKPEVYSFEFTRKSGSSQAMVEFYQKLKAYLNESEIKFAD